MSREVMRLRDEKMSMLRSIKIAQWIDLKSLAAGFLVLLAVLGGFYVHFGAIVNRQAHELADLVGKKEGAILKLAVENAYADQYRSIQKKYTQPVNLRFDWSNSLQQVSELPGLSELTQRTDARQAMAAFSNSRAPQSGFNNTVKYDMEGVKSRFNAGQNMEQHGAEPELVLFRSNMQIGYVLNTETELLESLYLLSTLSGVALNLYECSIVRTTRKQSLRVDCALGVYEIDA